MPAPVSKVIATHFAAANIYQAGVALLDLEDPRKLLFRGRLNVLEPREPWETTGQVPNVVFPSGLIPTGLDEHGIATRDSTLFLYYGAADTMIGLATATVEGVIEGGGT